MSDTVQAQPPAILDAAASFQGKTGIVAGFKSSVQSATRNLDGSISGTAELSSFTGALSEVTGGLDTVMGCFEDALHRTGSGLVSTAQRFRVTDTALYTTFMALDQSLQPFYAQPSSTPSPIPSPTPNPPPTPSSAPSHHHWWNTVLHDVGSAGKWTGKHIIMPIVRRVADPPKMPGTPGAPEEPLIPDFPDIPIPIG